MGPQKRKISPSGFPAVISFVITEIPFRKSMFLYYSNIMCVRLVAFPTKISDCNRRNLVDFTWTAQHF